MKIYIQKLQKKEFLFLISYVIYMSVFILLLSFYSKYLPEKFDRYILLLCVALLAINEIIFSKINFRTMMGLIICLLLFCISFSTNGNAIAGMIIFIYCGRNIPFERIAKWTIFISSVMVTFIVTSSSLGIINDYVSYSGGRVRHYLGFRYALWPSTLVFNISLLVIYYKNIRMKWKDVTILLLINSFFFYFANSRLSFGLSILSLLMAMIYRYYHKSLNRWNFVYRILVFSFIICAVISYVLTVTYSSAVRWKRELNLVLGDRLRLGQTSLLQYGINLFGQQIQWVGNGLDRNGNRTRGTYLWVDNLFIQVLQRYGIVFCVAFLLIVTLALYRCYQDKKYFLMLLMTMIALHCMIDDLQLYLYYNTFWFILGTILFSSPNAKGHPCNEKDSFC
ncbi:MAG: hypothetical protein ACI4EE_03795 [Lachnospiraceae bacterium]